MKMFLTFLIITYRRPNKVAGLLRLFLDRRWTVLAKHGLEIVVADDHGEDDTWRVIEPIVTELRKSGWTVRYLYRETNLRADRNLYYGYAHDSKGEYVWLLCDDDIIDVSKAIPYLETVFSEKPVAAICGFAQGKDNANGNRLGKEIRVEKGIPQAVRLLARYPKTTAYIMRRFPELNLDPIFERWDRTLHSWIGVSIYLFSKYRSMGVLAYPSIVASADDDFGLLQYGYRVFGKLSSVVKDSVAFSGLSMDDVQPYVLDIVFPNDDLFLCLMGLHAHYSPRSNIEYVPKVLEEELRFLKGNWWRIFFSFKRIVMFLKLLVSRILASIC